MLSFDVDERVSAEVALSHPYVATYHDPTDEPVVDSPFDWRFDNAEVNIEAWKTAVYALTIRQFRNELTQIDEKYQGGIVLPSAGLAQKTTDHSSQCDYRCY